jgi:hypothetical protein
MQNLTDNEHVNLSRQLVKAGVLIQDICPDELRFHRFSIAEQFVAEFPQLAMKIRSVRIRRRRSIGRKLSKILPETAAKIKHSSVIDDALQYKRVTLEAGDGRPQPLPLSYTRVFSKWPSPVALAMVNEYIYREKFRRTIA